jgi:hypothetical protein
VTSCSRPQSAFLIEKDQIAVFHNRKPIGCWKTASHVPGILVDEEWVPSHQQIGSSLKGHMTQDFS